VGFQAVRRLSLSRCGGDLVVSGDTDRYTVLRNRSKLGAVLERTGDPAGAGRHDHDYYRDR